MLAACREVRKTHHQDIRRSDDHDIPIILDRLRRGGTDRLNDKERAGQTDKSGGNECQGQVAKGRDGR